MAISVFDLFKVGIGPSSSHTVGPMRAAGLFATSIESRFGTRVSQVRVELYGSLGATGKGHSSDTAVMLGLSGYEPDTVDVDRVSLIIDGIRSTGEIAIAGLRKVSFDIKRDILFYRRSLPLHPNGMRFIACDNEGVELLASTFYSVGGGFVVSERVMQDASRRKEVAPDMTVLPLPFHSCNALLKMAQEQGGSIAHVMRRNEAYWREDAETRSGLLRIWQVMQACVQRGLRSEGVLPGGFNVKRRAAGLYKKLQQKDIAKDPFAVMDWVNLFAMAVNEENAAGGRVVTAPTNGAAGIVPAVLHYYTTFIPNATEDGVIDFLLTAAAIGILYKENASISGAEVGCQGEVGVACSMAAAGLCAVLGGSPEQVENAAEIAMEHHLGLTCDPVGGLVQIPCIERNAVASIKAINAARMALYGDGTHYVSLDAVIKTMRETGADMKTKYKETSKGGLAVNIVAC